MNETGEILELLRRDGIIFTPAARFVPLPGGVSSAIYLIEDGAGQFVVKRALAKLKVQADWFADVSRNRHEWEFIAYVARFLPTAVPALRHCSAAGGYFVMEHLNGEFSNWKNTLLVGQGTAEQAFRAAELLAQIHRHSAGEAEAKRRFNTIENFRQLRIEPYLLATGKKNPPLRPLFEAEAVRLAATRECLVHGDFSPKNILISHDRMVILDCEVAWYGDPAFDLAFLLNHFFLKALLHAPQEAGMRPMIEGFWRTYQAVRPSAELETRTARLILMLLLARVDGKSPVEYLHSARQDFLRGFVREKLPAGNLSLAAITHDWFTHLSQFAN
jgi:aminoglycoside phosphotransferase (APT) family kinase protein